MTTRDVHEIKRYLGCIVKRLEKIDKILGEIGIVLFIIMLCQIVQCAQGFGG